MVVVEQFGTRNGSPFRALVGSSVYIIVGDLSLYILSHLHIYIYTHILIIWREAWVRNAMQWKNQPAAPRLTVVRPRKTLCQGSSRLVCAAAQDQRPLLEPVWVSGTSSESYMFCAYTHIIYEVYVRVYIYIYANPVAET